MDEAGRDKLWQQYSKTHNTELRDELILEYAQLVKLVAGRLSMYLGYNVNTMIWLDMVYLDLLMLLINMIMAKM